MSDLISRQAVLKLLSTMPPEEALTKAMFIQSVQQMDAAQPEIIRCRECRYWYRMTINIGKCERVFNANCGIWDSDDYCSYAERPEVSE